MSPSLGNLRLEAPPVFRLALLGSLVALSAAAADKPRLAVVIVVDQLGVDAFHERPVTGGIKRLVREGYTFWEARYEAAPTITSVGHATIMTGSYGATHGIVSNDWIDAASGKPRLSTEDPTYSVLGRESHGRDGTAPTWLMAPTLADMARLANEKGLALSVSAKDRSAILCAGHAGLAVWFDAERPFFTTSTFYAKEPPAFLAPSNQKLVELMAKKAFTWGLPGGGITGKSPALPSRTNDSEPFAEAKELQPILDTLEVDVALDGVKALGLGRDDVPDVLTVSFSGHDRIGHEFGADSTESRAEYAHIDQEIGRLLTGLDALVGKGRYVVALTADHGVAPVPELAQARGLDAGRFQMSKLAAALDAELDALLGPQNWISGTKTPGLTLDAALRAKALTQLPRLRELALQQPGVIDLQSVDALHGPHGSIFAKGAVPGRSPDLFVILKPYWTYNAVDRTGHASSYLYDRAVPLVFWGPGVKQGQGGTAEIIDVAPTLSRLVGLPVPAAATGRSIDAVFR